VLKPAEAARGGRGLAAKRRMLKLAAGLLLAAAVALLLDWYAPAASSAPAGLRRQRAPRPAPGAEAANLLWAVQVSGAPLRGSAAAAGVVCGRGARF